VIEDVILADIAMGEDVIAEPLRVPEPGTMPKHQPGMRPQDRDVVRHVSCVRRASSDVDQGDALIARLDEVIGGHLRHALRRNSGRAAPQTLVARDHITRSDKGIGADLA